MGKRETNTVAIDLFKANRDCYDDNGIIWTTYCEVSSVYSGQTFSGTENVWIRSSAGSYTHIELRGFSMDGESQNTIFSAVQASISYESDNLIIQGTRRGSYYRTTIGAYDETYVSKL